MESLLRISEAANIAVHALAYMSKTQKEGYFSVAEIAETLNVSPSHLAKVMQRLVKAGFVGSSRGAAGGFSLEKSPEEMNVMEIIIAIDGEPPEIGCILGTPICKTGTCVMRPLLSEVEKIVRDRLSGVKLSDFALAASNKKSSSKKR